MEEEKYKAKSDYTDQIKYGITSSAMSSKGQQKILLIYVSKGVLNITINDTKKNVIEESLAIIEPFDSFKIKPSDESTYMFLYIPIVYLKEYNDFKKQRQFKSKIISNKKQVNIIYKTMCELIDNSDENYLIKIGKINILLGNICSNNLIDKNSKDEFEFIKGILMYIEENYQSNITLESISNYFGYSKFYFSSLFNKNLNTNLNDYLNLVRCRHVIRYVQEVGMSVSNAIKESGFNSPRTFYRAFSKCYGQSPKEYFDANKYKRK